MKTVIITLVILDDTLTKSHLQKGSTGVVGGHVGYLSREQGLVFLENPGSGNRQYVSGI